MARQFTFGSNKLELDIAGNLYTLNPTEISKNQKVIFDTAQKLNELSERASTTEDIPEEVAELIGLVESVIDTVLAEGASEKIFESVPKDDYYARMDVLMFISQEIKDFTLKKNEKYGFDRIKR